MPTSSGSGSGDERDSGWLMGAILVTGAEGFVGTWLLKELLAAGHAVVGGVRIGAETGQGLTEAERARVNWVSFDLMSADSVNQLANVPGVETVIHLAAVASGEEARRDPGFAWSVNAAGTARLAEALGRLTVPGFVEPKLVLVSTGEVYGGSTNRLPLRETDPLIPRSPYAASKVGAEIAAREVADRTGLRLIIARPFPHTGPGQSTKYFLPVMAERIRLAKRVKAPAIKTGNLQPVRDFLDVRDVARAYRLLAERGTVGSIYNIASGKGHVLEDLVHRLAELVDYRVLVEPNPQLSRANDLDYLVGDASKLIADTGWSPAIPFEQTLKDLVDAQTD